MIGKIKRVSLREVWHHEAYDFNKWLAENIDVLSDIIDINLSSVVIEKSAGKFSVDLVAEDEGGNRVVIENQLEKSNHDHLGKLITYLTAMDAKTAIWIVADPRPEHVNAISWLNECNLASFYLLKVEAIKIEESKPAPLLTLIVGPSSEGHEVGETKKILAEGNILIEKWWTALLDLAKTKTRLHANRSTSKCNWIGTSAGRKGLSFNYVVNQFGTSVELYIDCGEDSKQENERIFDAFEAKRGEIEQTFREPLEWEKLESKRACRIVKRYNIGGYRTEQGQWHGIHERTVDAMIRFEKALSPIIKNI